MQVLLIGSDQSLLQEAAPKWTVCRSCTCHIETEQNLGQFLDCGAKLSIAVTVLGLTMSMTAPETRSGKDGIAKRFLGVCDLKMISHKHLINQTDRRSEMPTVVTLTCAPNTCCSDGDM
jgi:hypothetical protein